MDSGQAVDGIMTSKESQILCTVAWLHAMHITTIILIYIFTRLER